MKLRLDGDPNELRTKGPELIKALVSVVSEHNPELADLLEKALPKPTPRLHYTVPRHIQEASEKAYSRYMDKMIGAIAKVLQPDVEKSMTYDYTKPVADKVDGVYDQVQGILAQYGYGPEDYLEGGRLYGLSVNALLDKIKELRGKD